LANARTRLAYRRYSLAAASSLPPLMARNSDRSVAEVAACWPAPPVSSSVPDTLILA
jgi:hypothetical protein